MKAQAGKVVDEPQRHVLLSTTKVMMLTKTPMVAEAVEA